MSGLKEEKKEEKVVGPIYGIHGSLREGEPKDYRSQLKFPLRYFDGKLKDDLIKKIGTIESIYLSEEMTNLCNIFDRFLTKEESDGKMSEIPKFFREYTMKVTPEEVIFTSIFEATCRMGFFQLMNKYYPNGQYALKMKRTIEYSCYKKNKDEDEEVFYGDIGTTIFGEDNGDY